MLKVLLTIIFFLFYIFSVPEVFAADNSFVTIVNPVRGGEFWSDKKVSAAQAFEQNFNAVRQKDLNATWLLRFDALGDPQITGTIKNSLNTQEAGLFLEVTPALSQAAGVKYRAGSSWHQAGSVLLTGYDPAERTKLIDAAFEKFRLVFGYYPKSVGAWWTDAASLSYMHQKYGVTANLDVADQFSTDGYQVWGQFWSSPFYPSKFNASQPAQREENKIGVVTIQWAARDPYNGFGERMEDSTYSVQPNDYILYHRLNINYFSKLLDIYLRENNQPFGQVTVGLENDFTQREILEEFGRQLQDVSGRRDRGEVKALTMDQFAAWYIKQYPGLNPAKIIFSQDPLGTKKHSLWYSNLGYRLGLFETEKGVIIRDLRTYSDTMDEPCLKKACSALDLARTVSIQIDDVTFKNPWLIREGAVSDMLLAPVNGQVEVTFVSALGKRENLVFAKNDIFINGEPKTIQQAIIDHAPGAKPENIKAGAFDFWPQLDLVFSLKALIVFIFVVTFFLILPGRYILRLFLKHTGFFEELTLGAVIGTGAFIILSYGLGFVNLSWLEWPVLGFFGLLGLKGEHLKPKTMSVEWLPFGALLLGVFLSVLPVAKSGLLYGSSGMAFWGPNGHDAIWHLTLIESLHSSLPPENFSFAGTQLINYHYFFDLLIASLSKFPSLDKISLYFRLWPVFESLVIGSAIWILGKKWRLNSVSTAVLILLSFTAGSWGWVVTLLRDKNLGGESMFWVNQAISLHLNPPFALSFMVLVGLLVLLTLAKEKINLWGNVIISVLLGTLWGIKAYAGALALAALIILGIWEYLRNRDLKLLKVSALSAVVSALVFIPLARNSLNLFEFSPFWLINSMISSQDRLNWVRLSSAIEAYFLDKNYLKLILAESLGLFVFVLGNLGGRIVSLGILTSRRLMSDVSLKFLAVISMLSLVPSLLFIQKGNPWNIVQFLYYSLFAATAFTAIFLNSISKSIPPKIYLTALVIFIFVSSVSTYTTLSLYYPEAAHAVISSDELPALNFLRSQPKGVVLTMPYDAQDKARYSNPIPLFAYETTSYVSSFADKPTYVSDEMNLGILGVDFQKRLIASKEFFKSPTSSWAENFLKEASIKYIYVLKNRNVSLNDIKYERIYEGKAVDIFRVLNQP